MSKRAFFIILSLLAAGFILIYVLFNNGFKNFQNELKSIEQYNFEEFQNKKDKILSKIKTSNRGSISFFNTNFNQGNSVAIREKDTSYSLLYLQKKTTFNTYDHDYLNALEFASINQAKNDSIKMVLDQLKTAYEKKFPNDFNNWYEKLKNTHLTSEIAINHVYAHYFPDLKRIAINKEKWADLDGLFSKYKADKNSADAREVKYQSNVKKQMAKAKSKIRSSMRALFDKKVDERRHKLYSNGSISENYSGAALGKVEYFFKTKEFDQAVLNDIVEEVLMEQWKNNSLRTGAMPYANCYGSSNYCGPYCSQITVKNSGSDAVVLVKTKGKVIRHAYIKGRSSFTFNVPDGAYSVYFMQGDGWNPNKKMKKTYCGTPRGGFVSGQSVTKDDFLYLNSETITYTLYTVNNGNFIPKTSSVDEAF